MNIHHLEIFYYVARHGGITEAARNIPYGIQQPAVRGQVAQLEEFLGVALFHRRPPCHPTICLGMTPTPGSMSSLKTQLRPRDLPGSSPFGLALRRT